MAIKTTNRRDLASLLGLEVVEELTLLASVQTTSPATSTGTGSAREGLGGGIVVLIVLLSCCCTCSLTLGRQLARRGDAQRSSVGKSDLLLVV